MKKFHFRLETLLKFRKMQEEQAQIKLAEANTRLQQEKAILADFEAQLLNTLVLLGKEQETSLTIDTLKSYSLYIDKIKRDIATQQERVEKAVAEHQECLRAMEFAMKQRKLVDNLKDKRLQQYNEELLQEEQKILDELGTQAFMRDKESV
ncbi:flagellar export protein FliJ [Sporomusa aerivorans]|uniref:flagellar export protein FliJ n=1 Tax=Sporomusa aerivorans TaxID=204936 RepID=UPI00352B65E8